MLGKAKVRTQIVVAMSETEALTQKEIARDAELSLSTVSSHLKSMATMGSLIVVEGHPKKYMLRPRG